MRIKALLCEFIVKMQTHQRKEESLKTRIRYIFRVLSTKELCICHLLVGTGCFHCVLVSHPYFFFKYQVTKLSKCILSEVLTCCIIFKLFFFYNSRKKK